MADEKTDDWACWYVRIGAFIVLILAILQISMSITKLADTKSTIVQLPFAFNHPVWALLFYLGIFAGCLYSFMESRSNNEWKCFGFYAGWLVATIAALSIGILLDDWFTSLIPTILAGAWGWKLSNAKSSE